MRIRTALSAFVTVAAVGLVACSDGQTTAPPDDPGLDLSQADAEAIALDTDVSLGVMLFDELAPPGMARGGERSEEDADGLLLALDEEGQDGRPFARRRRCPEGGWVGARGRIVAEPQGEGAVKYFAKGNGGIVECRLSRGDNALQLDGRFQLEAARKLVNGVPIGPQTTHVRGGFEWRILETERHGACRFDLTSVRHPDAMNKVVEGTICGREVRWERSWKHDE